MEGQQDQLRIRRLIREAESQMRGKAQLHSAQVEDLLEPLRTLLDDQHGGTPVMGWPSFAHRRHFAPYAYPPASKST
jgi:hypothetical protein